MSQNLNGHNSKKKVNKYLREIKLKAGSGLTLFKRGTSTA
jgi:hypothetical protein